MEGTRLLIAAKEKAGALAILLKEEEKALQSHRVEQIRLTADLENKELELRHRVSVVVGRATTRDSSLLASQRLLIAEAKEARQDLFDARALPYRKRKAQGSPA
jgi:hypothetical protein